MMTNRALPELKKAIEAAQRIALILHVSPDGDTCGSALALRRAFILMGKSAVAVCDDPVPHIYDDLDGADSVVTPEAALCMPAFDLAIAVDVADPKRLGRSAQVFGRAECTAQVDHHGTNPAYAQINLLRSPLSATGVLTAELIEALGVPLDLPLAKCLYVAIVTDTGNFKQQNTDAQALHLAAQCIQAGLDPHPVIRRAFDLRPYCQTQLLGRALLSMRLYEEGALSVMRLRRNDFAENHALPEHTEGIVNFGINTEGVHIACLLSEMETHIKCSMRALAPHDVSRVAASFGGGGHMLAAGCVLAGSLEDAAGQMREALAKELRRNK